MSHTLGAIAVWNAGTLANRSAERLSQPEVGGGFCRLDFIQDYFDARPRGSREVPAAKRRFERRDDLAAPVRSAGDGAQASGLICHEPTRLLMRMPNQLCADRSPARRHAKKNSAPTTAKPKSVYLDLEAFALSRSNGRFVIRL
jgi:hypothetical protein